MSEDAARAAELAQRLDRSIGLVADGPADQSEMSLNELLATASALKDVLADAQKRNAAGAPPDAATAWLRNENLGLTGELSERAKLLETHRRRLQKWRAECDSISSAMSAGAGLEPAPAPAGAVSEASRGPDPAASLPS